MARDGKSAVFEYLFNSRWDAKSQTLINPLVTLEEVRQAIQDCNDADGGNRSTRNPANFLKDYQRRRKTANDRWPKPIRKAGFTVVQRTSKGLCFEFVKLDKGADPFPVLGDCKKAERIKVQSLSMPLASKSLGRSDEAWLTQVAVKLKFIESYFALSASPRNIVEIDHLQMNAKLRQSEIDSVYLYTEDTAGNRAHGLILLEAKGFTEDVGHDQLLHGLKAGKGLLGDIAETLLPMALKVVHDSLVHVMEFEPVAKRDVDGTHELALAHEAVVEVVPSVPGI